MSIVLAASVVFVLTGVVPIGGLAKNAERTQGWFVTFAVAGILLLIPLAVGSQQALAAANDEQLATAAVEAWLAPSPGSRSTRSRSIGDQVEVAVAGRGRHRTRRSSSRMLDAALGGPSSSTWSSPRRVVYRLQRGPSAASP